MKEPNLLPHNLYELRTKAINWRQVTNDFDFFTIREIIERWANFDERRIVARIIGSNMSVDNIRGINNDYIQPALDLITMYMYRPGTENRKNMESLVKTREEEYRRKLIGNLKSENESLKKQVEKLKQDLTKGQEIPREKEIVIERAFNGQTEKPCLTSTQMGILLQAVAQLTEEKTPAKTTLGEVVERIGGYSAKTVNQNMKGAHRESDTEAVAKAIESKLPKLAEQVRKM